MNDLKQRLLSNWHVMRILRVAIGVWMLVVGIQTRDWAVGLLSVFFLYQGVTDTGCCGAQSCYTPPRRATKQQDAVAGDNGIEEIK